MKEHYDIVIIGGGSAGITAACFAIQLGAKVAIVERGRVGGDCTWTGCVPSKTLLKVAKVAHQMRTAHAYGLDPVQPNVDLGRVMSHVRNVVNEVYEQESTDVLRGYGIDVLLDEAHFLDPNTLAVGDTQLAASRILIATGARPIAPPVEGLDSVDYLTYETVWDMETLPQHLIVVGAGPVGSEMTQAFRRLGTKVTLVDAAERMLLQADPQVSHLIADVFAEEGVDLRFNAALEKAWQNGRDIHVIAGGEELVGDALLIAVGRRPVTDGLQLEQGGLDHDEKGIYVDDNLRTSQDHIYAAGDCIGGHQFTHYAGWQGFMAVRNALLPTSTKGVIELVPWATFTDPEVAQVGLNEAQARERYGDDVTTSEWSMGEVDRALAERETTGYIKFVHTKGGTPLGATIVAGRAGEMIHECVLALDHGLKMGDIASSIHIYPTYSTAMMQMAADIRVTQLLSGTSGRLIRGISRLIR